MTRALDSVLVVYKKSDYQIHVVENGDPRISELIAQQDGSVERLLERHEIHQTSVQKVRAVLEKEGIQAQWCYRSTFQGLDSFDLVISVGGDGTLLDAAHLVRDQTPVLGVNSSPTSSVGYLCATDANGFQDTLHAFMRGELPQHELARIEVERNGVRLLPLPLNDVLFAHELPAATTRYELSVHGHTESQRSSGLWVSTASGSTAAMASAGGVSMSLDSQDLQFLVRELYQAPGEAECRLRHGYLEAGDSLSLVNKNQRAYLFLDGPWNQHPVYYGDQITIRRADSPLILMGRPRHQYRQGDTN